MTVLKLRARQLQQRHCDQTNKLPAAHTSPSTRHCTWVLQRFSHIRQQYSHLFHQASPSVAACLATDPPNVVGTYLKTCFAQRQSFLASPLLAWLLNFVELD
ncbi:TPA: hypothetical protein ACH3X1_014430 [Trebouxia sp. C0004]